MLTTIVGLALTEQLLPSGRHIPMDATDVALDALILGDGTVMRSSDD
jgi:5-formyltetrahydrofolate cyclo-ligase